MAYLVLANESLMFPYEISFKEVPHSDAIALAIQERLEKLERYFDRILFGHVTITAPHRHHRKGKIYHIQVRLRVPMRTLVATREPERNGAHKNIYVAIRDTFRALERELEDYVRCLRGQTKTDVHPPRGVISKLFPSFQGDSFGFIESDDGRDVYFHENSVLNKKFDELELGDLVTFHEEAGFNGPQASSLKICPKRLALYGAYRYDDQNLRGRKT